MQEKFDGPWYSWQVTPPHIKDRWFTDLAHRFIWNPLITHLVRDGFDKVAANRLKGMVSYAKSTGKKPSWIRGTLWTRMQAYWKTEEAIKKSKKGSTARNSPRDGLGPHKHCGGPKSHTLIQREMSKQEGREVSIVEVFIKTHTRKDGTFVDEKAKKISEAYNKNLQSALSQAELSTASDGASSPPQLTTAQVNDIFLKSTIIDSRGIPYGIGSLGEVYGKGKKKPVVGTNSGAILALEEQLKEAQAKLEEQASQSSQYKSQLDLMMKYMTEKDPAYSSWLQSQSNAPTTSVQPSSSESSSSDDEEEEAQQEDDNSGQDDPNNADLS